LYMFFGYARIACCVQLVQAGALIFVANCLLLFGKYVYRI
jgi:hypothetical protein